VTENIDRAKVLRFFTWTSRELGFLVIAIGCMIVATWVMYLGVAVALKDAERASILLLTSTASAVFLAISALFFRMTLRGDKPLLEFHDEVKKAKSSDFANVLIQSFRKTETALNNLLDFHQAGPVAMGPDGFGPEDRQLLEALSRKAVLLFGRQGETEFLKFLFNGTSLVIEYSPISVAVLYLTKRELIAYLASADILKGEVSAGEIRRIPLQKVAGVTMEPVSRRIVRTGNERLFLEYERVIKNNPSHELAATERSIRVAKADGQDLILPAGDPLYWRGKRWNADADEGDRFTRIASEVSRRIEEAKRAAEGELPQNL